MYRYSNASHQELRAIETNHIVFGAALALGTPWQQAALVLHSMRFEANRCHMVPQSNVVRRCGELVWQVGSLGNLVDH